MITDSRKILLIILQNLIIGVSYTLIGNLFESSFSTIGNIVSPIFPSTGIGVAGLLLCGFRVIPGVWLGDFVMMVGLTHSVPLSMYVSTAVLLQMTFAAWIYNQLTKNTAPFYRLTDVIVLFSCASFLACLIGSSIGVIGLYRYGFVPLDRYYISWFDWWLSDSLGVITMVSLIMAVAKTKIRMTFASLIEAGILFLLLAATAWIEYQYNWPAFLLLLFPIWAAIRFKPVMISFLCIATSTLVFYSAFNGYKQFQGVDINQTILFAQSYVAIIFFVALLLHSILFERQKAQDELIQINQELEQRIIDRTQDLHQKNIMLNEMMQNLKQAEAQLVQAEKMSALGVLTAGIAHEINNAINFISANINPLKRDIDDISQFIKQCEQHESLQPLLKENDIPFAIKESHQLIESIKEGVLRSVTIVKDLRTFSRLDEGQVKTINIHENLDSTLNLLQNNYKDHITIVKHYGDIPNVECEPGKINQVFMNLLMNAIQAISEKGEIIITTSSFDQHINISIKDTGAGMSPEVIKQIFEPFFTTKEIGQGTGLGLSISYGIIQDHHGKIVVNSELQKGSEFVITLPLQYQLK